MDFLFAENKIYDFVVVAGDFVAVTRLNVNSLFFGSMEMKNNERLKQKFSFLCMNLSTRSRYLAQFTHLKGKKKSRKTNLPCSIYRRV